MCWISADILYMYYTIDMDMEINMVMEINMNMFMKINMSMKKSTYP